MCPRQSRKVTWDMINTLFLTIVAVEFICGAFLQHTQTVCPCPQVPFLQIFLKKSELKTTHNAFWDCRVHIFFDNLSRKMYTALSRKVVEKIVHATILKGNLGYVQYTVRNDCSCRTYFGCFPLALANICPWPPVPFFQVSLRTVHSKPPTIPFEIVACTFSDNLSPNSCIPALYYVNDSGADVQVSRESLNTRK